MLGVCFSGGHGPLLGNYPLRHPFPQIRQQGGQRPSGARLAPHLRTDGGAYQLLQQIQPLAVSREADPVGDPQGRGW